MSQNEIIALVLAILAVAIAYGVLAYITRQPPRQ